MRKIFLAGIVSSAALIGSPAFAADFVGPRAEVRAGFDRISMDLDYDDGIDQISGDGHDSGVSLGGELGYDALIGRKVIAGAYAGVEFSTTKECGEVFGDDRACLKAGRNFTLGARLGTVVSPKALLYVKGGYSNGQLKASYTNAIDPTFNFSDHANRGGWHLGAGVEYAIAPKSYVRLEYVRTGYNDYDYSDADIDASLGGHRDQVLVGFGLRF